MRIFHDRLTHDKYTDRKHRWVKFIKEVKFQLYIIEDRVPEPTPKIIEVSIFAHKTIYSRLLSQVGYKSVADLTQPDKNDLAAIGLSNSGRLDASDKEIATNLLNRLQQALNSTGR